MTLEKSTCFKRSSVIVLEPHSMSARPRATASKRDCDVTGTPEGKARMKEGILKLVGAVYELKTGRVRFL